MPSSRVPPLFYSQFIKEQYTMYIICPKCRSDRISIRNIAKTTGSIVGTVAGAASVAAGIVRGAELGALGGMVIGPVGTVAGGICGAIVGGLLGGTAGGAAGAKLGQFVDENILRQYHCLTCKHTFSKRHLTPDTVEIMHPQHGFHMHPRNPLHGSGFDHDEQESEFY
jgi:hypothetical protein